MAIGNFGTTSAADRNRTGEEADPGGMQVLELRDRHLVRPYLRRPTKANPSGKLFLLPTAEFEEQELKSRKKTTRNTNRGVEV